MTNSQLDKMQKTEQTMHLTVWPKLLTVSDPLNVASGTTATVLCCQVLQGNRCTMNMRRLLSEPGCQGNYLVTHIAFVRHA